MGWAKVQEIRRHVEAFRASGKFATAYMKVRRAALACGGREGGSGVARAVRSGFLALWIPISP